MKQDLNFPDYMLARKRWKPRTRGEKYPYGKWAESSDRQTFDDALAFWQDCPELSDGLCYILHPGDETGFEERVICFDVDGGCIDENGECYVPEVAALIDELGTYTELSLSGKNVHICAIVECKPFTTKYKTTFGKCTVDVLCNNQIAATGTVYKNFSTLRKIPFHVVERFGIKVNEAPNKTGDCWSEDFEPIGSTDHLVEHMTGWPLCARSTKGSKLGEGGDVEMYRAANHLVRRGVTGEAALELLRLVPADPEFTDDELRHKIECAFRSVHDVEDEFGKESACHEFEDFVTQEEIDEKDPTKWQFLRFDTLKELMAKDLEQKFIVDKLFVRGPNLFIGGRPKTFKTGFAAELAVSLCMNAPFFNHFEVNIDEPQRVSFFTAEIGDHGAQNLLQRILREKRLTEAVDTTDPALHVHYALPAFTVDQRGEPTNPKVIRELRRYLKWFKPDIAIFDPLYLSLCGAAVGDMYGIGAVLKHITDICREYDDIWPIFCHHSKKQPVEEHEPMQLHELYGAGVTEFVRQWALLSHAEPFENGLARLYCNAGGSTAGDCGVWRIDINEGMPDAILDRKWDVQVHDALQEEPTSSEDERKRVIDALVYYGTWEAVASIAMYSRLPPDKTRDILVDLVHEGKATLQNQKFRIGSRDDEE